MSQREVGNQGPPYSDRLFYCPFLNVWTVPAIADGVVSRSAVNTGMNTTEQVLNRTSTKRQIKCITGCWSFKHLGHGHTSTHLLLTPPVFSQGTCRLSTHQTHTIHYIFLFFLSFFPPRGPCYTSLPLDPTDNSVHLAALHSSFVKKKQKKKTTTKKRDSVPLAMKVFSLQLT